MIEITGVSKSFGDIKAVDNITLFINDNNVMGLLGTNGAGKSTLLRMMAGILKPDQGAICIDGVSIWDDPQMKSLFFYISDDQFYFPNATPRELASFYSVHYEHFDQKRFYHLLNKIELPVERKIRTFSKGMKKQLSILIGICANTSYLYCDETFDGLDPIMRQSIKSIFADEMNERSFTPVIASHNLRELEDISDHIGLLHKGGVLLSKDLDELRNNLIKIQCVLPQEYDSKIREALYVLKMHRHGKLLTMTVRGEEARILSWLNTMNPIYCEAIPLTLEEIFICETEAASYDYKNIIF